MEIRILIETDWEQVWPILRAVVRAGDTFTYDPALSEAEARALWIERPPGRTLVALQDGQIVGTGKMGPNRAGPGAHIATASFMVAEAARGKGIGEALVRAALDWARGAGYAGMQFNAVAATNAGAIALYQRLGFSIVGTIPGGFMHPVEGRVDLHILYCAL